MVARTFAFFLIASAGMHSAAALRDVPLGECYQCEVSCFEDCTTKYNSEIMADDMFLQVAAQPEKNHTVGENRTAALTDQYTQCLQDSNCPCRAQAQGKTKALQLVVAEKKKKSRCAVGEMSCSSKCADKVVDHDIARLTEEANQTSAEAKRSLLQKRKGFPVRSVSINAFAKGKMTLDHCFKYCLAATCGCEDAPGISSIPKLVKQNAAAKGVIDTKPSAQYRPATMAECAKGMQGKKVAKGMYIKMGGGPDGMYEVCSKEFLSKVLPPGSDAAAVTKRCKSSASEDAKYGCTWSNKKGVCIVGFSPILRCQTKYFNDKSS